MDRHAPFGVVVGSEEFIAVRPSATLKFGRHRIRLLSFILFEYTLFLASSLSGAFDSVSAILTISYERLGVRPLWAAGQKQTYS